MHSTLALGTVPLALACLAAPPGAGQEAATTPAVLQRVGVVGASVSAGFGLQLEGPAGLDLAKLLDRCLKDETGAFHDASSLMAFQDAEAYGERAVAELKATDPTLVVGVDFLFWLGYGLAPSPERRMERLEAGLRLLESLPCPVLVGDLPDMSPALEAEATMILEAQIPSAETLKALNARIHAWAGEREKQGVLVVPLADFVQRMFAGEVVELRGNRWKEARDQVLQKDLLHPSLEGALGIAVLILDTLVRGRSDVEAKAFRWDVQAMKREWVAEHEK